MTLDVLCIGEAMALVAPDPPVALQHAQHLRLSTAGAEANVAVWLATAGTGVQWCGRVGADPFGRRVLDDLAGHGVGLDAAVVDDAAPTGVYFKDPGPEHTAVWYYRASSAGSRLDPADVDRALALRPRIVHLSGITPALSDTCRDAVDRAIEQAHARGITVSLDVNYRPALWVGTDAGAALAELAHRADVVLVGRDEATALWGTDTSSDVRALLPGVPTLVVKDGSDEALAHIGDDVVRVEALPVEVVEPVGAGDAFAAGYLRGILLGFAPEACLRLGHLVAARALTSAADVDGTHGDFSELEVRAVSAGDWGAR